MIEYNKFIDNILYYLIFISEFIYKYSIFKYCYCYCYCKKHIIIKKNLITNDNLITQDNLIMNNNKLYKLRIKNNKIYRTNTLNTLSIFRVEDAKFLNDDEPIVF